MTSCNQAIAPLLAYLKELEERGIRVRRIRLSPFQYRRLQDLIERRNRVSEQFFGEPKLPDGVAVKPNIWGIPIDEARV